MSVLNRRNAALGWLVWQVIRRVGKRKAKAAIPGTVEGTRRPNAPAIALAVSAAAGALWLWWRLSSGEDGAPGGE
jgi:hypothetical protein